MTYLEYRDGIERTLKAERDGLTWRELKVTLNLPYARPCPNWTARLEQDIRLDRSTKRGRQQVWRLAN